MAARGKRDRGQETFTLDSGVYTCSKCGRPLQLEMVVSADVERLNGLATGYVVFQHFCKCDSETLRVSRGWGSHPSFLALFGKQPALPYRAPFAYQGVTDDDKVLSRWRWELEQLADWQELVLFLDDAAGRAA
ncbi:MAG: hypothetical protein M3314_09060 [Actinomycetota bacterium]|nr:hypothetical protein [Actinomycetota bacterium]